MAKFTFEVGKKDDDKQKSYQQQQPAVDTGIIQKIDALIEKAIEQEATDIHFEPATDKVVVRMRLHGVLQMQESFPINMHGKIVNRVKVLSGMDITRNKIPQSGFFKVITDKAKIEMITCTFPTLLGEKVLLNIQYKRGVTHSLDELGMSPKLLEQYNANLRKTNGLIVVGGPPGNGKTTTLYATLNALNSPGKSLATFEHVVKYEIPGIIQGKPDEKAEFSFEDGVRAMVNLTPDVMLIGEVQLPSVAKSVIQAAFAKRIVLARMSADNSINALQNFIDMGLQPFLVTSAVNMVLVQRLVRKLCSCKEKYTPPEQLCQELGIGKGTEFFKARGCSACRETGYSGQTGIFELLTMKEELSEMFIGRESPRRIREVAVNLGLIPLRQDGIVKAQEGITSLEEVFNVV